MIQLNKPIQVKRNTKEELRFHPKMGALSTRVTRIQKTLFGFPIKTLHKYRETYSGRVKDCNDCNTALLR